MATHAGGNLLDLLITVDGSRLVSRVDVVAVGVSDHDLVVADVDVDRPRPYVREFSYRKIGNLDRTKFRSKLLASPAYTAPVDDVDGFADQLDRSLTDVLDELAPLLTQTKRCGRRSSRWLSSSAVRAKRTRRRLERRWRRTGLDEDRAIYRRACRTANAEITKARESFHRQRLESTTGNPRAQWRVVRELLHSNESDADLEPADARKLCDSFSNFFRGKLRKIADEIQTRLQTTPGLTRVFQRRQLSRSLNELSPVTVDDVLRVIKSLPPKSSPLDCLPVSLLKECADVIAPLLVRLANASFSAGVFPTRYKFGRVIPLLKKPGLNKDDPANYRPITNLCTFSKVLEKLALARLQPHLLSSSNFSRFQSAYRSGHSTETALLRVFSDINVAADGGKCTVLLALDISAAF